jgi:hypothetical protein
MAAIETTAAIQKLNSTSAEYEIAPFHLNSRFGFIAS